MMTVLQAFQEFLSGLELTTNEQDEAVRQHTFLRTQIQQRVDLDDNFLSGSYKRNTAVRPLKDIDVFAVFKRPAGTLPRPSEQLERLRRLLSEIYPSKEPTTQSRSVNIEFSGTGIAYDVVPAYLDRQDVYTIPDRDVDRWILSNPKVHAERSTAANERSGKKLKPLVKAVKHANRHHEGGGRSFHLEVLSWEVLTYEPANYLAGLIALFEGLRDRMLGPCPDPAGLGPDIGPSMERRAQAQRWLKDMAERSRRAQELMNDGRLGEAHAELRIVFGPAWPERGSTARASAAIITSGSLDHSGSRFG